MAKRKKKAVGSVAQKAAKGADALLKAAREDVSAINKGEDTELDIPTGIEIPEQVEEPVQEQAQEVEQEAALNISTPILANIWFSKNVAPPSKEDIPLFRDAVTEAVIDKEDAFEFKQKIYEINSEIKMEINKDMTDRINLAEGGDMAMPDELQDTYSNIPPEEMAAAKASQLPDDAIEETHEEFILDEALSDQDQDYLMDALENDSKLSTIFDRVMDVATEFSGAGEVKGLGTGVSDSIPARLSDGEFVFTKKAVDQIGAENLQIMMDDAERAFDEGSARMEKQMGGEVEEKEFGFRKPLENDSLLKQTMLQANQMPSNIRKAT